MIINYSLKMLNLKVVYLILNLPPRTELVAYLFALMKHIFTYSSKVLTALLLFFFVLASFTSQAEIAGDSKNGKKLFNANCGACHRLDIRVVGPALAGITETRTEEWLVSWIKDNAALRASGDADAIAIFEEYGGMPMNGFTYLSDQDILDILAYTEVGDVVEPTPAVEGSTPVAAVEVSQPKDYSLYIIVTLGIMFALLLGILIKMRNTLNALQGNKPETLGGDIAGVWGAFAKNKFLVTVVTIVVGIFFLAQLFGWLLNIGVETGYQPVQPIAYSHKVHAGDNKIDCNYCHSSARHSKTSGIPSANVCMNCHMMIDGSEVKNESGQLKYDGEPSPEIAKIYASVGWDGDTKKYIEDYEQTPIKWVRVHNLPDLAYFNHAQHVTAGKVKCQTCHGPVEEMEEVYQYSELTMGWCIECHRTTEVKMDNDYYKESHDKLVEKFNGEKITVERIGGLECGKCHY